MNLFYLAIEFFDESHETRLAARKFFSEYCMVLLAGTN
jgi:hypothetical protein